MNEEGVVHTFCLEAFAAVSAMVSHDLKNTLAIINENAGLLDDLAVMAGEEGGVATARVRSTAAKIAQQVARSNTIIKYLNRFAHSGDSPVALVDMGEVAELMTTLTVRKAAARKILAKVEGVGEVKIQVALLPLEALLYRLLVHLYATAAAGSTVVLRPELLGGRVVLRCAAELAGSGVAPFPGEGDEILLARLGGSCRCAEDGVMLILPVGPGV